MALRNISNIQAAPLCVYTTQEKSLVAQNRKLSVSKIKQSSNNPQQHQPQIRTSSPISSTTSDSFDAPPEGIFPSEGFKKHHSIKDLAYEKLRNQQITENQYRKQENEIKKKVNCVKNNRSHGKLKMLAYNNFGHLTVHIIKGKNYKLEGETYVKINMLPDRKKFYNLTSSIKCSNQRYYMPFYNEKFSFEVDQLDTQNRLCISVWIKIRDPFNVNSLLTASSTSSLSSNIDNQFRNDKLLGCFSFRIKNLMSNGPDKADAHWYHLLPENIGMLKHFRCHKPQSKEQQTIEITNIHKDLIGMKKMKFLVSRSQESDSFGFTITGNCPCMISKVNPRKQPFFKGLKSGDFIAAINNKNVSRGTCDSVVKLIKSFKTNFEIEIYRKQDEKTEENMYYEIPPLRNFERHKLDYNLEVVPEEREKYSDLSENDFTTKNQSSTCDNPFELRDEIRHVDSDIDTDGGQIEERQRF